MCVDTLKAHSGHPRRQIIKHICVISVECVGSRYQRDSRHVMNVLLLDSLNVNNVLVGTFTMCFSLIF